VKAFLETEDGSGFLEELCRRNQYYCSVFGLKTILSNISASSKSNQPFFLMCYVLQELQHDGCDLVDCCVRALLQFRAYLDLHHIKRPSGGVPAYDRLAGLMNDFSLAMSEHDEPDPQPDWLE
jgi:hypothetical protein